MYEICDMKIKRSISRICITAEKKSFPVLSIGQFGWPTFGVGAFVGMLAATIATIIETVGVGYGIARICALPPPPQHSINRGIAIDGLATVLFGFFGVCHGTSTYSTVIGFIGITGVCDMVLFFTEYIFTNI